jgi:hypothetical protein
VLKWGKNNKYKFNTVTEIDLTIFHYSKCQLGPTFLFLTADFNDRSYCFPLLNECHFWDFIIIIIVAVTKLQASRPKKKKDFTPITMWL